LTPPSWRNATDRSERQTGPWRFATNLPDRQIGGWRKATGRSERKTGLRRFATDLQELRTTSGDSPATVRRPPRTISRRLSLPGASAGDFPPIIASRGAGGRFPAVHGFPGRARTISRRSSLPGTAEGDFPREIAFRLGHFHRRRRFPAGDH
jgi:hypothetical protein